MSDQIGDEKNGERVTLCPADAAALDAVMEQRAGAGLKLAGNGKAPAVVDAARKARLQGWLNVVGASAVPAAPVDLLGRTMAAVEGDRMKLKVAAGTERPAAVGMAPVMPVSHAAEKGGRKRSHLAEVAAMLVAATLLLSVLVPAVGQARQSYRRTLCATNLAAVGTGFGMYAQAYEHQLPTLGVPTDRNWLTPAADGHTNTANLLPLVNASYVPATRLVCAGRGLPDNAAAVPVGNDIQDCGYSYVNLFGAYKPTWNGSAATIVLADRNPLFVGGRGAGGAEVRNADMNSLNHAGKGTYLLRADGHVTWEISPNIGGDNIWTVGRGSNRVTQYAGTEVSTGSADVFLSP